MTLPGQQDSIAYWDPDQMIREPILAVKLYALFAFISFAIPIFYLLRNWVALVPFKRPTAEKSESVAALCVRQAKGLQRWMGLNALAWLAVTAAGFSNGLRGIMASKRIGAQVIAFALNELTLPLLSFLCVMMVLYTVRWHILWRGESLRSV